MFPLRDENPVHKGFKPVVTYGLIAANVAVFLYEIAFTGQFWEFTNARAAQMFFEWGAVPACVVGGGSFSFNGILVACPAAISGSLGGTGLAALADQYMPLISSMFMHGGLMHIGGNMLFLWIFGDNIEAKYGRLRFLGIYVVWGVVAGLAHIAIDPASPIPAVGASGAISGILGAYLIIFPRARILTFLMLGFFWQMMRIQAKWFLPFWLIFQNILPFLIGGFGLAGGGVAYMAHIGGFLVGLAFGYVYRRSHESEFTYGTRYGWRGDRWRDDDYYR